LRACCPICASIAPDGGETRDAQKKKKAMKAAAQESKVAKSKGKKAAKPKARKSK
jgi:hypothetical protein